jgi:hypothetical protein
MLAYLTNIRLEPCCSPGPLFEEPISRPDLVRKNAVGHRDERGPYALGEAAPSTVAQRDLIPFVIS